MKYERGSHMDFVMEMSEHHISAREFFCNTLLDSLDRNFGLKNVLISYFDTQGRFLSWTGQNGLELDGENHPYRSFMADDVIRRTVYQAAVRDRLTYFNVEPRVYRATDIIGQTGIWAAGNVPAGIGTVGSAAYEDSAYVSFLEENFHAHYSAVMAFGINAYIQVTILKELEQGDFSDAEMEELNKIYVYIANFYKNFKKHEQAKIVSHIQSEVIASGEKAYLVTDDFLHVMSYNKKAQEYLRAILGSVVAEQLDSEETLSWLAFLLGGPEAQIPENRMRTHVFNNYTFKIYTYDQSYSNGIVDRYHWITISGKAEEKEERGKESKKKMLNFSGAQPPLTQTEKRVAALMYSGLTYKAMADELVVSYHTVKNHVQNIYTKCGVKSRFQLCEWLDDQER